MIKVLFIGDIFGKPGRRTVKKLLPLITSKFSIDLVIANCENLAGGLGVTPKTALEMFETGINVFTSGNHLWDKKEIIPYLEKEKRILRPVNYPPKTPGNIYFIFELPNKMTVGIINLIGRIFTITVDCPFRISNKYIKTLREYTPNIIVDFHAETTSEKSAIGWYLDGKVSAVLGTHTHVQTADERILPKGTAYITDVGMTGAHDSIIGIRIEDGINRFINRIPSRFNPAKKNLKLDGVIIELDEKTGKSKKIKRISLEYNYFNDGD